MLVPTVWVQLMGGLGNQMFQYAAGRALSGRHGTQCGLDLSWFDNMSGFTRRQYGLGAFPMSETAVTGRIPRYVIEQTGFWGFVSRGLKRRYGSLTRLTPIDEPHFHYWDGFEGLPENVLLRGYWQSERYFRSIIETIIGDFSFPAFPFGASKKWESTILNCNNAVAVHIRRGDYVHDARARSRHSGCCTPEFYRDAIRLLEGRIGRPQLYLFSDEPSWLRNNLDGFGTSATLIDVEEHARLPHHDMHLMSLCRHHIIANSSFSWWSAWLSRTDGIICAPKQWFADSYHDARDVCPPGWNRL